MVTPNPMDPRFRRLLRGRVMSTLAVLFLLFDAAGKLARVAPVVEGTTRMGYPDAVVRPLGLLLLACTALYVFPRTALLGVVLLTGYLGGAVATHVRVGDPLLSHVLFPVYLGGMLWMGLLLRDDGLRALISRRFAGRSDG